MSNEISQYKNTIIDILNRGMKQTGNMNRNTLEGSSI